MNLKILTRYFNQTIFIIVLLGLAYYGLLLVDSVVYEIGRDNNVEAMVASRLEYGNQLSDLQKNNNNQFLAKKLFDNNGDIFYWQTHINHKQEGNRDIVGVNKMKVGYSKAKYPLGYLVWTGDSDNNQQLYYGSSVIPLNEMAFPDHDIIKGDENIGPHVIWRWHFVREIFEGFSRDNSAVGYLGLNGFVEDRDKAQPMGMVVDVVKDDVYDDGIVNFLWVTEKCMARINFYTKKFYPLFAIDNNDKIKAITLTKGVYAHENDMDKYNTVFKSEKGKRRMPFRHQILVKTDKAHYVIMSKPDQVIKLQLPHRNGHWEVSQHGDGKFYARCRIQDEAWFRKGMSYNYAMIERLMISRRRLRTAPLHISDEIYTFDATGKITLLNRYAHTYYPKGTDKQYYRIKHATRPLIAYLPGVDQLMWYFEKGQRGNGLHKTLYAKMFSRWSIFNTCWVLGLVIWYGHKRKQTMVGFIGWLLFVACFNLAGGITYWLANKQPIIKCQACGKQRGINTNACNHCKAPLAKPMLRPADLLLSA